jgi:WD40 repeat protein
LQGLFKGKSGEKPSQIMEFAKQPTGLSACKWVDSMPGTFVTASDRHGVIRMWNVSNANPMHMIKTEQGAVSSIACLEQQSAKIVVSFKSGEVALVDLKERRTAWATEGGHTETIFDCSMSASVGGAVQVESC